MLFSLGLKPVTDKIEEEVEDLDLHVWLLDDGHCGGDLDQLQRVAKILEQEGPPHGLYMSTRMTSQDPKSNVWGPGLEEDEGDPLGVGVTPEFGEGITVLGAPVGSNRFEEEVIRTRMGKIKMLTEKLELLHDSQLEFVLLRSTLALPKFIYILRTVDPTNHCQLWEEYDGITKVGLERILAGAVTHRVWEMAKLKVNDGGLGLRAAQDHGLAAYAVSKLGTQRPNH